ncbi:MAG: PCMD domain-containing protein [Bacteroidaceae bacterium]|nr:PCMD domain-containing protein [Bacteroidaceae bacterium]
MKNLTKYTVGALLVGGAALLTGCSSDALESQGQGYIQLSGVTLDKSLTTRAGDGRTLSAQITDAQGNIFAQAQDWTELQGQTYLVAAGQTYTVKAQSNTGSAAAEGFDAQPFYEGQTQVTVRANRVTTAEVEAKLAQAKVSVQFTDAFKQNMVEYSAKVAKAEGTDSIAFDATTTAAAFIKAGRALELDLNVVPQGTTAKRLIRRIVEQTQAAYLYKVVLDVNTTGGSTLTVNVDPTVHEYEITLGVPLKSDAISTTPINGDYARVWGTHATLAGVVKELTGAVTFEWRQQGTEAWQSVAATQVGTTGEYTAQITGLTMGTTYEYKIKSGDTEATALTFTTEAFQEIPNLGFDTWTSSGSSIIQWFPNADTKNSYWATGNPGTASGLSGIRTSVTQPTDNGRTGKAAVLTTHTGVNLVGSAAGNLFIGAYSTNMTNPGASVQFGRPYSGARPAKLTGWYKYDPKPISNGGTYGTLKNEGMDEAHIYVKIYSDAGIHGDNMDNVIGYGEVIISNAATDWTKFEIDITYTDRSAAPAGICILATSSHYGGHFEGTSVTGKVGNGSQLTVDDFELSY